MSSRQSIQQIVSTTPPPQVALGDEWYNPTANKLYKSLFYNGAVQWSEIPILGTVSTSSFTVTGNTVFGARPLDTQAYDPFFNKVDVLMHFDGDVVNSALSGMTGTVFNVANNLSFTTGTFANSIGASGALQIAGVSNNTYVRVGNYGTQEPQIAGNFTIEMWFSYNANEGGSGIYRTLLSRDNASPSWMFYIYNSQQISFNTYGNSTAFNWNQGNFFQANVWYHIAAVRFNGVIRFFINGILQTTTLTTAEAIGGPWRVGAYGDSANYRWNGRIDELRITRDVARYTANFIPPRTPFPDANYPTSVAINYPTVSFSSSTGALIVEGGIASRGDLNVAGDIRSWGQIRSNYFYSNDISSGFNAPRVRPAFQVKGPMARTGDIYGSVTNAGLGYDSSNNYVYISNTDGNIMNSLWISGSQTQGGWNSNSSGLWTWPTSSSMSWSDVFMGRDGGSGQIGIRRQSSTLPSSLFVYNHDGGQSAFSTPTNYERAVLDWQTTVGTLTMGVQALGTGQGRNIRIVTGNNTGTVTIIPGTASTSTNTGALQVLGGIGVGGNVYVGGNLVAVSKSFLIDHPTKKGMQLQYGSLEGPENGVYIRGRLTNVTVINLPDYWTGLVDKNSITATLTPIGQYQDLWIQDISNNQVTVGSTSDTIDCFYTVYGERKDIGKLCVEFDK